MNSYGYGLQYMYKYKIKHIGKKNGKQEIRQSRN